MAKYIHTGAKVTQVTTGKNGKRQAVKAKVKAAPRKKARRGSRTARKRAAD